MGLALRAVKCVLTWKMAMSGSSVILHLPPLSDPPSPPSFPASFSLSPLQFLFTPSFDWIHPKHYYHYHERGVDDEDDFLWAPLAFTEEIQVD